MKKHRPAYPRRTCEVEGCRSSSTRFDGPFICGRHYRLACPPRTLERRVWNRVRRQVGKHDADCDWLRLWRLWRLILRRAAQRDAGWLDVQKIAEIIG